MINNLKPYPAMKNSGVPWLGEVPEHWEVRKLRSVLREVTERNRPDLPLLSVVREKGVILRDLTSKDENHNFIPDDLSNYKVVRVGQCAMNKMKAWQGSYGISQHDGIVSPAYFTFNLEGVDRDYFHKAIRSEAYIPFFKQASDGVRIGQWDLSKARMREIPFFVPPLSEQAAIVRYLDYINQRVKRYVSAKERLIKLLEEEKQAIIHRAVTRGLDPNVRLKPSGVEWLGEVPEHWVIKPLKRWVSINEKVLSESTDPDYEFNYFDIGCVGTGILLEKPRRICFRDAPSRARRILRCGDTIISMVRTYLKSVYFVTEEANDLVASTGFAVLTPRHGVVPEFIAISLQSYSFIDRVTANSIGIAYPAISETLLGSFHLALPPTVKEQTNIVLYVRRKIKSLTKLINRYLREIELLREYHTRLIADVVTGKVDVREVAASLPNETEESGTGEDEKAFDESEISMTEGKEDIVEEAG